MDPPHLLKYRAGSSDFGDYKVQIYSGWNSGFLGLILQIIKLINARRNEIS